MSEISTPVQTNKTLIKAIVAALLLAIVALVLVVLPAEYNIDPTGLGKKLGLTDLAESEPQTAVKSKVNIEKTSDSYSYQKNSALIEIPAGKGLEYKVKMAKHANLTYSWSTTEAAIIHFDFHGEPAGDTTGYFESFTLSDAAKAEGSLTTPFAGVHGWYWKNGSSESIQIRLEIEGNYELIGQLK